MNLVRTPWALLGAALLLTTCSPEYKSGVTACAEKEPRCPEGYVCSGIRCFLAGEVPDGGAVLGGGGGTSGSVGTGGMPPVAGRGGAGGMPPTGGRGGTGGSPPPPPSGQTVLKFCNAVTINDMDFEAELVVGSVSIKALTGTCAPAVGQPCVAIPTGQMSVSVRRAGTVLHTQNVEVTAGIEHVVALDVDDNNKPVLLGGDLQSVIRGARCSAVGYKDLYPSQTPDAGAPNPPADAGPQYPPAAACAGFMPEDECERCAASVCCNEFNACFLTSAGPECGDFLRCFGACPDTDQACRQRCQTTNMVGFQRALQLVTCQNQKCAVPCMPDQPRMSIAPEMFRALRVPSSAEMSRALRFTSTRSTSTRSRW